MLDSPPDTFDDTDQAGSAYDPIFERIGKKYGIDPLFLKAQARYESRLDPKFKNPASSASGIAAFTDATAKDYNVNRDDPESSIDGQARYLSANYKKFHDKDDPVKYALSAYKTGPNSDTIDDKYVKDVLDVYNDLKANASNKDPTPEEILEQKLGGYRTPAKAEPSPEDVVEQKFGGYRQVPAATAPTSPESVAPSTPTPTAPVSDKTPNYDLGPKELLELKEKDPEAADAYMRNKADMAVGETAYGLGDVPRSIANTVASAAPEFFSNTARAYAPAYAAITGQPPLTPADYASSPPSQDAAAFKQTLANRNAQFQQDFGQDPSAGVNRLVGNFVASAPALGVASELTPALPIVGGKVLQYGFSGLNAARMAPAVTALTNASSNADLSTQLGQNAVVGGVLGAAAPAAYDLGIGTGNFARKLFSSPEDVLTTKAQTALQQLTGGDIDKLDLKEYVPGSKPTLAQAAASGGSQNAPSVAGLERTLAESNPNERGALTIPGLVQREQENNTARRSFLDSITGSQDDLTQAYQSRAKNAKALLEGNNSIWKDPNIKKADVSPVVNKIDEILNGPDKGNDAVQSILGKIKGKLAGENGQPLPDSENPEYLYRSGIKTINQWLEDRNTTELGQLAKAAKPQVKEIKAALDKVLDDSTPGYKNYLAKYAEDSKPVNQMELLQGLSLTNQPGPQGVPTLAKVDKAIEKIKNLRAEPTLNDAKSLTQSHLDDLESLRADLLRKEAPNKLLSTVNSATDPKYAMRKKVTEVLGTGPEGRLINPRVAGATAGAAIMDLIPLPIPGKSAFGAYVGEQGGRAAESSMNRVGQGVQNKLVDMMLNPHTYSSQAPISLMSNFGDNQAAQNLLGSAIPYGAVGVNRLLLGSGSQ